MLFPVVQNLFFEKKVSSRIYRIFTDDLACFVSSKLNRSGIPGAHRISPGYSVLDPGIYQSNRDDIRNNCSWLLQKISIFTEMTIK